MYRITDTSWLLWIVSNPISLLLKLHRQTNINRTSRVDGGEVAVPGAGVALVEQVLDADARFEDEGVHIE